MFINSLFKQIPPDCSNFLSDSFIISVLPNTSQLKLVTQTVHPSHPHVTKWIFLDFIPI